MNTIKHYETTLKQLNDKCATINDTMQNEKRKLEKCEVELRKHYDGYLHALAQHVENYLYKTQQNLFSHNQKREWFFIEPIGLGINRDKIAEYKYMNACLVCIISESGDVVKTRVKEITTPNQVYDNSTLFNMVRPYVTNDIKPIRHTRLIRQVRHDIRNFIKRNDLQNIIHDLNGSTQTIIENEVREIIINTLPSKK